MPALLRRTHFRRRQLRLIGALTSTLVWFDMDHERQIDPADWDGTVEAILEIHAKTDDGNKPFLARLYNDTLNAAVSGSNVSISATSNTRGRSSAFSLASGANIYHIQYGGVAGATYTPDPYSHAVLLIDVAAS